LQPARSAALAGLRYVSDTGTGIVRQRAGAGFRYLGPEGRAIGRRAELARIKALAIPPAWSEVWICPREDGHIQATGRDARGRKQYRYHARWREARDETKFGRMAAFARALPRIRRRVREDLARPGLPREKVLAVIVRLLETTFIRVGNEEYARRNASFGLTTLRERQVRVRGATLKFRFRGKSGVAHDIELTDSRVAAIVRRVQDLPGEELFQYLDEQGESRGIESADVNAYLREVAGDEFTTKDFRTWAGTLLAARTLRRLKPGSAAEARRNVVSAIDEAARQLGNTRTVCRKCYIHPALVESYLEGRLAQLLAGRSEAQGILALLTRRRTSSSLERTTHEGKTVSRRMRRRASRRFGAIVRPDIQRFGHGDRQGRRRHESRLER
jgi:DNA topoisomerase I